MAASCGETGLSALLRILQPISLLNTWMLRIGRQLAWVALAIMVVVIFLQVVFRYGLNNALPWPDELARFFMLWMTGLVAPTAFRWGGFVAIDLIPRTLPTRLGIFLNLILLCICLTVLVSAVPLGLKHVLSGCLFNSATLYVPFTLEVDWLSPCNSKAFAWGGFEWNRVKLSWMFLSVFVGVLLLIAVSVELILRNAILLIDPDTPLEDDPDRIMVGSD